MSEGKYISITDLVTDFLTHEKDYKIPLSTAQIKAFTNDALRTAGYEVTEDAEFEIIEPKQIENKSGTQ